MNIERVLMEGLNVPDTDADDNEHAWYYGRVATGDLKQAMLDALHDSGAKTNHTPTPKPIALNDDDALTRRALGLD